MAKFAVYSPTYTAWAGPSPYLPDDVRLPEEACDYIEVEAPTNRAAIILAVRLWSHQEGWVKDQRGDGHSPFTGLKAELLEEQDA
ncbi:MAG: hypothetical protein Q8R28_11170 [Dehalococcoidia bacterium]|nr:hypothetical protein [Dehalococcoidia bacterium]